MEPRLTTKYWRKKRNVTQKELCNKINISQSYLSEIENGIKLPGLDILFLIAEVLETCPKNLIQCIYIKCRICSFNGLCKYCNRGDNE